MEKAGIPTALGPMGQGSRARRRPFDFKLLTIAILLSLVAYLYVQNPHRVRKMSIAEQVPNATGKPAKAYHSSSTTRPPPWHYINASESLEWHPCYNDNLQCALLTVPMDYDGSLAASSSGDAGKVHIALLLVPPKNVTNVNVPMARSPMFLNPGGPGGAGTFIAMVLGRHLQTIFGDDLPVIGFDPRGVGSTLPRADCWTRPGTGDDDPKEEVSAFFHRVEWLMMNFGYRNVNLSTPALAMLDAGHRATNDLCLMKDAELGTANSILGHASTAHVAKDMVTMLDKWDEWQEKVVKDTGVRLQEEDDKSGPSTKGKLVYWGFSYGTYLGQVFASLFPDRVGRLILDGVVDGDSYVTPLWAESIHDTDKVVAKFGDYCVEAGSKCALYRSGDKPSDVRDRFTGVIDKLAKEPLALVNPDRYTPTVIPSSLFRDITFSTAYSPVQGFPTLAYVFNLLYEEDHATLSHLLGGSDLQTFCNLPGTLIYASQGDAQKAVMCADKTHFVNLTVSEIQEQYEELSLQSSFADVWIQLLLTCNGWKVQNDERPALPWESTFSGSRTPVKTAFPILFLSNTYDPVTPLIAAVKMALKFDGAGLLEQKSEGHCTIAAVSKCTIKAVQDYINGGKLPPPPKVEGDDYLGGEWNQCEADERPWQPYQESPLAERSEEGKKDAELMEALQSVQSIIGPSTGWLNIRPPLASAPKENHIESWGRSLTNPNQKML